MYVEKNIGNLTQQITCLDVPLVVDVFCVHCRLLKKSKSATVPDHVCNLHSIDFKNVTKEI